MYDGFCKESIFTNSTRLWIKLHKHHWLAALIVVLYVFNCCRVKKDKTYQQYLFFEFIAYSIVQISSLCITVFIIYTNHAPATYFSFSDHSLNQSFCFWCSVGQHNVTGPPMCAQSIPYCLTNHNLLLKLNISF